MFNTHDILETITMIQDENLDIRTVTMGISLLDCIDSDIDKACSKVYDKITRYAKDLVPVCNRIEHKYGIPIINKRIAVTPIAMLAAACQTSKIVKFALTLEKAAQAVGVNFIGGYSALVQKGFAGADKAVIESIPEALAKTDHVCASVNIGSTKNGINLDAVALMGKTVKKAAELTADRQCIGAAKLVDGMLKLDETLCNRCGRCKNTCPFGVTSTYISGYKICLGGRWGKRTAQGIPLSKLFTSEEEVLDVIERTINFYREEGLPGERFADTIARLGFEYVESKVVK